MSAVGVYKVKAGKRGIGHKFILGAAKAFPGYKLGDLFYVGWESKGAKPSRHARRQLERLFQEAGIQDDG